MTNNNNENKMSALSSSQYTMSPATANKQLETLTRQLHHYRDIIEKQETLLQVI